MVLMDVNKVDKLMSVVNRLASAYAAYEELVRLEQFIDSSSTVRGEDAEKAAALCAEIVVLEHVKEEILNE